MPGTGAALWVQVEPVDPEPVSEAALELAKEYRAVIENILETRGAARVIAMLPPVTDADALADSAGYSPDLDFEQTIQAVRDVVAQVAGVREAAPTDAPTVL